MIAVNIHDAATAEAFVSEVAAQFKTHRTVAPTNTCMLLITIIGPLAAGRFAERWRELAESDGILRTYMSLMRKADVIQGTTAGKKLSKASLLSSAGRKPWWRFW